MTENKCVCEKIGKGVQVARLQEPLALFETIEDFGPDYKEMLAARKVWRCLWCQQLFAFMTIPFKDEEDIIVRGPDSDWSSWNWKKLGEVAAECRWRGPDLDPNFVE